MSSPETIRSQLLEMGFGDAQASAYSDAYASLEAALEALLRDEAAQGGPPMPAGPESPNESRAAPLPATAPTPMNNLEERKEAECGPTGELAPSQWLPLRLAPSPAPTPAPTPSSPSALAQLFGLFDSSPCTDDDPFATGEAPPPQPGDSEEAEEFEVLHAALFAPSQTDKGTDTGALLGQCSAREIRVLFAKAEALANGGPTLAPESASLADTDADTDAEPNSCTDNSAHSPPAASSALASHTTSTCSTPRNNNEAENECVYCFDAAQDTLLLPCRHFSLCSCCALDYVQRIRTHNHSVHLLQLSAAEEDRTSRFVSSVHKHVARVCACPTCATPVEQVVRRRQASLR